MGSSRRVPSGAKTCCAPAAQTRRTESPGLSPTLPDMRAASVAEPTRQVTSESAPRYSTAATVRRHRDRVRRDMLGPHAERQSGAVGGCHRGAFGARDHRAAVAALERQQVHRRRADEARDERVGRTLVELDGRRILLDPAAIEQHDAVGHRHRLDLVVRHVDHRDPELSLQVADLRAHLLPQLRVEIGQGLVHQAHRRFGDDRAAERDALLLSAGELRRLALEQAVETEELGGALQPSRDIGRGDLAHLESEHDVLGHGQVREQRVALEHHRDVAPRRRKAGHVAPVDQDAAARRRSRVRQ